MIYEYIHDESGEIIEKEFPMEEDHPATVEENGKIYRRVWSFEGRNVYVHIPFQWGENSYNFTKRDRDRRKYK